MNFLQVDAALDLSHTQNIGRMIKAHFPQSQVSSVLQSSSSSSFGVLDRSLMAEVVS